MSLSRFGLRAFLLLTLAAGMSASSCKPVIPSQVFSKTARVPVARVALQVAPEMPTWLEPRLLELLRGAGAEVIVLAADAPLADAPAADLTLGIGASTAAAQAVFTSSTAAIAESLEIKSREVTSGRVVIAARGGFKADVLGALYATYTLLERLGFAFLHPLEPLVPETLTRPGSDWELKTQPRWRDRGIHLHTQHPLELTDLLQGFGLSGPQDVAGWRAMLPHWRRFCEWAVANRLNRVQWILLWASAWRNFADSPERQARLKELVSIAHEYGLLVGIDAPISLEQQHAYRLVRTQGTTVDAIAEARARIDYLMATGIDYLATEAGTTEFTHGDGKRFVGILDGIASHLDDRHGGKRLHIKVHCSTGQYDDAFKDRNGKPLNVNFLPMKADPRINVMPHTVQYYDLDDPAPTYGNSNFAYMRDFMQWAASERSVWWYPETAYWVSFDVDVPLFLPIYGLKRVADLRMIAADEDAGRMGGKRIDGQVFFSSGWEWGYWLNDVVTARASYDPRLAARTDSAAFSAILEEVLAPLGQARDAAVSAVVGLAQHQDELLVRGQVAGRAPKDVRYRNGQAYLQGWEAWDDVFFATAGMPGLPQGSHQPFRVPLFDLRRDPVRLYGVSYAQDLAPLLQAMAVVFGNDSDRFKALVDQTPAGARGITQEFADAAEMTALRARHVQELYSYVDSFGLDRTSNQARLWSYAKSIVNLMPLIDVSRDVKGRLNAAESILREAATIVARREKAYRLPTSRIASWRHNPTSYDYTYLWTVHTLYYWWRDQGLAKSGGGVWAPCFMNIIDPVDTAKAVELGVRQYGFDWLTECFGAPANEPAMPPAWAR